MTRSSSKAPLPFVRTRRIARIGRDILVGGAFGTMIVIARTWGTVAARISAIQEHPLPNEP
jgi:hypothetical protein